MYTSINLNRPCGRDRLPYAACDIIIVKQRWNSTCAGRRDFSNHTQIRAIHSNRREKNAKNYVIWNRWFCEENCVFLYYPSVLLLPNNFGSSRGLEFRENASQPSKTWTWIEDLRFWCERLWDCLVLLLAEQTVCAKEMHERRSVLGYQSSLRR